MYDIKPKTNFERLLDLSPLKILHGKTPQQSPMTNTTDRKMQFLLHFFI